MKETLFNTTYVKVVNVLKQDGRFTDDEGELLWQELFNALRKMDAALIKLLLEDECTKKIFFVAVEKTFVFDSKKVEQFLRWNSSNNSYSRFLGQSIGLYQGDTAINDIDDVVLNFPFKDCVLEGGQSTEEGLDTYYEYDGKKFVEKTSKREEIFYNEILAQDEIDQLFEPKAFTNAKRFSNKSEKKLESFTRDAEINKKRNLPEDTITDNLVIKGNNLLALHSLDKEFHGKVKLIYIDPPYNTGSDDFSYNDKFNRSTWLTFLKNRLEIAKELMTNDGAIYVQLDYNQVHYAKVLMDEIFGEDNFQREIIWRIGWLSGYKTKDNNWIRNHDTILFYSKNKSQLHFIKNYIPKKDFKKIADTEAERYPIEDTWNSNEYDDLNSIAIVSFAGETVSKLLEKEDQVKGQKSEKLMERIINAHTQEGDIVLDFFGGSGSTAASAHKMKRQYITCEQIDEHIDIMQRRLSKVVEGEQSGISKRNNWRGGGSFVYLELAKKNESAKELIKNCSSYDELMTLFDSLCKKYFLHYNVRINEFKEKIIPSDEFKKQTLPTQKKIFTKMLDLNQMWVNASEMDDSKFGLSKDDIKITNNFYQN